MMVTPVKGVFQEKPLRRSEAKTSDPAASSRSTGGSSVIGKVDRNAAKDGRSNRRYKEMPIY
jgi:hypothetical protein